MLKRLESHKESQELRGQYAALNKKPELSLAGRKQKERLSAAMGKIRGGMGLSDAGFQAYLKVCGRQFPKCLSSQQVQKEASRVWAGTQKVLPGDGKDIHFKKYMDFNTVSGKTNTNGVKFDKGTLSIRWPGLTIPCRQPKQGADASYTAGSLGHKVSYCGISRKMFPNGWHYYVAVYRDGDAPKKHGHAGTGMMGIDPGVFTMAGVSDTTVFLEELAPGCKRYAKGIMRIQEKLDRSRRASNPGRYNEDGTVKKGRWGKWNYSRTYKKDRRRLKSLYRQKAAYTKQSHEGLAGRLLKDSLNFIVEDMPYKSLQKRAGKTGCREEAPGVAQKDGTTERAHKHKRRKRFGKSLNGRAPAMFLSILEKKALALGGPFVKVGTKSYKASQYGHVTDNYAKAPLSQREKTVGRHPVQRGLYSACLIRNSNETYGRPDRAGCIEVLGRFWICRTGRSAA